MKNECLNWKSLLVLLTTFSGMAHTQELATNKLSNISENTSKVIVRSLLYPELRGFNNTPVLDSLFENQIQLEQLNEDELLTLDSEIKFISSEIAKSKTPII